MLTFALAFGKQPPSGTIVRSADITLFETLNNEKMRAFSSAGSEHLPYKQRVGGSNPSTPTHFSET